jgi:hypothetical protein
LIPVQRDLARARVTLQHWLARLALDDRTPTVGELEGFAQGFSGEILTFDVHRPAGDQIETTGMVVRIEPGPKYQLFLDTNFEGQYRVMEALARHTAADRLRARHRAPRRPVLRHRTSGRQHRPARARLDVRDRHGRARPDVVERPGGDGRDPPR